MAAVQPLDEFPTNMPGQQCETSKAPPVAKQLTFRGSTLASAVAAAAHGVIDGALTAHNMPDWFTGSQAYSQKKMPSTWYRNSLLLFHVLPVATLSALWGLTVHLFRKYEVFVHTFDHIMFHPYAAQVFGIVIGWLIIMRLNQSVSRWDGGMNSVALMSTKLGDAQLTLMSFIEAERTVEGSPPLSEEQEKKLQKAEEKLVHLFSLLHACAMVSLSQAGGECYGTLSDKGKEIFRLFRPVKITTEPLHNTLTELETLDEQTVYKHKNGWPTQLVILGDITPEERAKLSASRAQVDLVCGWVLLFVSQLIRNGVVKIPPPCYTRVYQEISNGMLGYSQAARIANVPFPEVITRCCYIGVLAIIIVIPVVIEKFTQSIVMTPLITLITIFMFLVIHCIAIQLESPFGEDFVDLPLLEIHSAFNSNLLVFGEIKMKPDPEVMARQPKFMRKGTQLVLDPGTTIPKSPRGGLSP
jgi:predicted membrane chloride channel (bestrophin family)